jgi:hypothetical protein
MKKPKYKNVVVLGKTYRLKVADFEDYIKESKSREKPINPPGD